MRYILIIAALGMLTWPNVILAQAGSSNKIDSSCYYANSSTPPEFSHEAQIDSIVKDANEYDFIALYDKGDYSNEYNYVRLFKKNGNWYFKTRNKEAGILKNAGKEIFDNKLLDENIHIIFLCANSSAKSYSEYYLFYSQGKITNSLISNVSLSEINIDTKLKPEIIFVNQVVNWLWEQR